MNEADIKLLQSIGKRLTAIEEQLAIKDVPTKTPAFPTAPKLPTGSDKANKFFGGETVPKKPQGVFGDIVFKDEVIDPAVLQVAKDGQTMLKKAIIEFCEEFDIKEFNISYVDNKPKK